jgi:hypothetical protein
MLSGYSITDNVLLQPGGNIYIFPSDPSCDWRIQQANATGITNLQSWSFATEVHIKSNPTFAKADGVFFKQGSGGWEIVIVENKLNLGTAFTTNQNGLWSKIKTPPHEIELKAAVDLGGTPPVIIPKGTKITVQFGRVVKVHSIGGNPNVSTSNGQTNSSSVTQANY